MNFHLPVVLKTVLIYYLSYFRPFSSFLVRLDILLMYINHDTALDYSVLFCGRI